ncbi:uncharacterized protein LOC142345856 isoform X2 [Convolutriloba macropyga]|uniref:uncharacterized protein LOC142345856 isoform X2 n=1 Tax=Convolutriloba macropyga TaxID=536237 RepID=UPI003F528F23
MMCLFSVTPMQWQKKLLNSEIIIYVFIPIAISLALAFLVIFIFTCSYTSSKKKNEKGAEEFAAVKRTRETKGQRTIHATCDEELAHSAHLYHYQLKKKQLLEQEANQSFVDEDDEEGDVVLLNQRIRTRGMGIVGAGALGGGRGRDGSRSGGSLSDDSGKSSPSGSITLHHKKHSGPNGVGVVSGHETVAFVPLSGVGARGSVGEGTGGGVESNDVTTVYECNGLAASNDFEEIEVRNPLFQHDISHDTTNENETTEQSPSPPPQIERNFSDVYYYQNEGNNYNHKQNDKQVQHSMQTKGFNSTPVVNGDGSLEKQHQLKENGHSHVSPQQQTSESVVMELRSENGDM